VARVEEQNPHLLAGGGAQPVEQQHRLARRGDRGAIVGEPALGQLPERRQPDRSLGSDMVIADQARDPQRAPLPERQPGHPFRAGGDAGRRHRAAEDAGDQLGVRPTAKILVC
jgi:hypothetical protein